MKLSELTKKFKYSSINDFCKDTNTSASVWTRTLRNKKFSPKIFCAEEKLRKLNLKIYEEAEKKAEQEYWERERIIKQIKSKKFLRKEIEIMEWKNVENEKPNNDEQIITYDGAFYCLMYYYTEKPVYENFNWEGEGFYACDDSIGIEYKTDYVTHWARLEKPKNL